MPEPFFASFTCQLSFYIFIPFPKAIQESVILEDSKSRILPFSGSMGLTGDLYV